MNKPEQNRKIQTLTFVVVLLVVVSGTLYMIRDLLQAVLFGVILALMAGPSFLTLQQRGWTPKAASLAVTLGIFLLIVAPFIVFGSLAVKQGMVLIEYAADADLISVEKMIDNLKEWQAFGKVASDTEIENQIEKSFEAAGLGAGRLALAFIKSIPLVILQLGFACLTCFYLLFDGRNFARWIFLRIPLANEIRGRLTNTFRQTTITVVLATLAAAIAQSLCMIAAFVILSVPGAFLAGGLTFVFAFIPFIGSFPVWFGGSIYLFFEESIATAVIMLLFGAATATIDNVIRPWILQGRSAMHPLVSLIAIFGGIATFGLLGAIIGPVLVAILISLLQVWTTIGYEGGLGLNPNIEVAGLYSDQSHTNAKAP